MLNAGIDLGFGDAGADIVAAPSMAGFASLAAAVDEGDFIGIFCPAEAC